MHREPEPPPIGTHAALSRVLAHSERRCWHPRASDVCLSQIEVDALVHRGLLIRVAHGRLVVSAAGFERIMMGQREEVALG